MASTDTDMRTATPPAASLLTSACGRRGCSHIHMYPGLSPFKELSDLVTAHTPHCIARNPPATHPYYYDWQPNEAQLDSFIDSQVQSFQGWAHEDDGSASQARHTSGGIGATSIHGPSWPTDHPHFDPAEISATSALSEGRLTRSKTRLASAASASGQSAYTAENSDSASARVGMPRILAISDSFLSPGFENIRRVIVDDTEYPPLKKRRIMKATTPSDATTSAVKEEDPEPKPKKTARTEAERIADLRADFWALEFTAHTVECRGCRRTITLDRRSTYYSGLFDKHKERCTEVLKGTERQAAADAAAARDAMTASASDMQEDV